MRHAGDLDSGEQPREMSPTSRPLHFGATLLSCDRVAKEGAQILDSVDGEDGLRISRKWRFPLREGASRPFPLRKLGHPSFVPTPLHSDDDLRRSQTRLTIPSIRCPRGRKQEPEVGRRGEVLS